MMLRDSSSRQLVIAVQATMQEALFDLDSS